MHRCAMLAGAALALFACSSNEGLTTAADAGTRPGTEPAIAVHSVAASLQGLLVNARSAEAAPH